MVTLGILEVIGSDEATEKTEPTTPMTRQESQRIFNEQLETRALSIILF